MFALCAVNVASGSPIISDDTQIVLFVYCGKAEHFDSFGCIKFLFWHKSNFCFHSPVPWHSKITDHAVVNRWWLRVADFFNHCRIEPCIKFGARVSVFRSSLWETAQQIMSVTLTFYSLLVTWCTNSLTFNNCTLCPHCIYVFCFYLRTNSDLCHLQHKLIGFYNRDEKCLQRGTDWVFK